MAITLPRTRLPAVLSWARDRFPIALRTETPFDGGAELFGDIIDPGDPRVPLDFFETDRRADGSLFALLALDPQAEEHPNGPDFEGVLGVLITQTDADTFRVQTIEAWGDDARFEVWALDGRGRPGTAMESDLAPEQTQQARFMALKAELARLLAGVPDGAAPTPRAPVVENGLGRRPLVGVPPTEDERHELVQWLAMTAYERTPEPGMWGIECYGDASPGIGGGQGGFLWFDDWEAFLTFAREHLVHLHWG